MCDGLALLFAAVVLLRSRAAQVVGEVLLTFMANAFFVLAPRTAMYYCPAQLFGTFSGGAACGKGACSEGRSSPCMPCRIEAAGSWLLAALQRIDGAAWRPSSGDTVAERPAPRRPSCGVQQPGGVFSLLGLSQLVTTPVVDAVAYAVFAPLPAGMRAVARYQFGIVLWTVVGVATAPRLYRYWWARPHGHDAVSAVAQPPDRASSARG